MTYLGEEKPSLEYLVHAGVMGMKWGVRKSGNRVRGALSDQNQRSTAVLTRARENRAKGISENIGRGLGVGLNLGTKRFNKNVDKELSKLDEQKKRIEGGKLSARDILQVVGNVGITDLLVSVRDNKG